MKLKRKLLILIIYYYSKILIYNIKKFCWKTQTTNLVNKTDFDDKLKDLNKKVTSNKVKHVLVENELKKLKTFDSSLFIGEAHLHLIFQPIYKIITAFSGLLNISE